VLASVSATMPMAACHHSSSAFSTGGTVSAHAPCSHNHYTKPQLRTEQLWWQYGEIKAYISRERRGMASDKMFNVARTRETITSPRFHRISVVIRTHRFFVFLFCGWVNIQVPQLFLEGYVVLVIYLEDPKK